MIFNLELTAETEIQGRLVLINFTLDEDAAEIDCVTIIGKNKWAYKCNSRIIDRYSDKIWSAISKSCRDFEDPEVLF